MARIAQSYALNANQLFLWRRSYREGHPWGDQTPPAVWFAYTPDRKGEHPIAHLSEFTGTLQAGGYAGYEAVYKGGRVKEAASMAHVLRAFYELYEAHKSR
ncbi:MAG: transposase, family [Candidatus Acidoferrum typicum]|nr:transposase, family [Candidatus Acidoferrum typicum]